MMSDQPQGGAIELRSDVVGGAKPLHRFLKVQPKSIGVVFLMLGLSYTVLSIPLFQTYYNQHFWSIPGIYMGAMLITCGILYIIAEHHTTKKNVTIALALSIVGVLGTAWVSFLTLLPTTVELSHEFRWRHYEEEIHHINGSITHVQADWVGSFEGMLYTLLATFLTYSLLSFVLLIMMSSAAGSAVRSSKTRAMVVVASGQTPSQPCDVR